MRNIYKLFLVLIVASFWFIVVPTRNIQATADCVGKGVITYSTDSTSLNSGGKVVLSASFKWGPLSSVEMICLDENISINFLAYANGNYNSLSRVLVGKVSLTGTRFASYNLTHARVLANPAWLSSNGTKLDTFARAENQQFPVERNDLAVVVSSHINIGFLTSGSGGSSGSGSGSITELPNPIGINTFEELVNVIGVWIFNLAIPIAVIVIIYAGVVMLTAGGNPGRFQKGAKALWYAVLGLAVVFIGKGFVTLIESILNLRNP